MNPPSAAVADRSDRLDAGPGNDHRILVVDDNEDAADMLAALLEVSGYRTRAVFDAPDALAQAATFKPEAALVDIGLPGMDGYELARRLRGLPELEGIRLVAVTGYGQDADRARSFEAGFDEHLVKPVDAAQLEAVLVQLLRSA